MVNLDDVIGETRQEADGVVILMRTKYRGHLLVAKCRLTNEQYASNSILLGVSASLREQLEFMASRLDPVQGNPEYDRIYQNWEQFVDLPTIIERVSNREEKTKWKDGF